MVILFLISYLITKWIMQEECLIPVHTMLIEVGLKVGYNFASHFIAAFKKKFGTTPKNIC